MSRHTDRHQEVQQLRAYLRRHPDLPEAVRLSLEQRLVELQTTGGSLRGAGIRLNQQVSGNGDVGVMVGLNLGRIIYRRTPSEEQRNHLVRYLRRLADSLRRLPLRGLAEKLDDGQGISLPAIYTTLATSSVREEARGPTNVLQHYFSDDIRAGSIETGGLEGLAPDHNPALALPDQAITRITNLQEAHHPSSTIVLFRAVLATEAVQSNAQLVLLGDPGSGKSTFLRHLAWSLAMRGLDCLGESTRLAGWNDQRRRLPLLLTLKALARRLAQPGTHEDPLTAMAREQLSRAYDMTQSHQLLDAALERGAALLLFDGLDEVPLEGSPGVCAGRMETLRAVRDWLQRYPANGAVITCRSRAFTEELRACIGWPVETLAPFTPGQIRYFAQHWYAELEQSGQLQQGQAELLSGQLISVIEANASLRAMAGTPLLLTLMAIILYHDGALPRDRPQLYERVLSLLLGQWDKIRDGEDLASAIGQPGWDSERIRSLLDRLSYEAHSTAESHDGRGRLGRSALYTALIDFFRNAGLPGPGDSALRCLDYFEQRSGLLLPDGNDSYAFAHLTLQEHCAGRHLAIAPDATHRIMAHRIYDHWREPILLGLGVVQSSNPALLENILLRLTSNEEDGAEKPLDRWYRDLLFAGELGRDRDWSFLCNLQIDIERVQRALRKGLTALLADSRAALPATERQRAALILGEIGDPRLPVLPAEWRSEPLPAAWDESTGYWCYVPPGTYRIGGWDAGKRGVKVPLQPFWIGRFPVTCSQYAHFMETTAGGDNPRWWTQHGWEWKMAQRGDEPAASACANLPVTQRSWYEASAFARWLSEELSGSLPSGYVVRLPTEAEWEAAAAYDGSKRRRKYPWGEEPAGADRAVFREHGHTAAGVHPVGTCPAGAAACGALDLAGLVWEWTASSGRSYPERAARVIADIQSDNADTALRGGSWQDDATYLHCGSRNSSRPDNTLSLAIGFRLVIAPQGDR